MFAVAALFLTSVCVADPPGEPLGEVVDEPTGLRLIDWCLIAIYAISTIGLGVYIGRQQRSTEEYFVGGGNLNPMLVGVSLFATLLSTISYLSMPGEAAGKGPVLLVGIISLPIVYCTVAFFLLPVYMRQRVTSAYELLEERLGLSVRLLGASMFLALRLVWMTLLVYLAAKAMTVMLGVDYWIMADGSIEAARFSDVVDPDAELPGIFRWGNGELRVAAIPVIVLVTGIVSVIYTTLGGLRAVVVTDFMQTCLLFGGALLVVATVTYDFGGFGWFPTEWHPEWDTQPILPLDPDTGWFDPKIRVSVVGTILSGSLWYIATLGGDQTTVQRFMATRDAAAARRALVTQLCVGFTVTLTLVLVGFSLLSFFTVHADTLPAEVRGNADDYFPRFIAYHLPPGISGLVVAAMFAAAMSSIDSGVNSITAVVLTDFFDRLGWRFKTDKGHLRAAKLLALAIGVTVVLGSAYMKFIEGNITAVTNKTVNLLATPIFCLFFFALFVKRVSTTGVWIGALCGTVVAVLIAFSGPFVYLAHTWLGIDPSTFGVELITKTDPATGNTWTTAEDAVSFQWIAPAALVVNLVVGYVASVSFPSKRTDK